MYMSYCRFEGTKHELWACMNEVDEHTNEEADYAVSDREIKHFQNMVIDFVDWLNCNQLIDESGEVDRDMLEWVSKKMAEGRAI